MSEKLPTVDRLIFLLFLVAIAIPFIFPLALPLPISSATKKYYSYIAELKPGAKVIWFIDITLAGWAEAAPGEIATLNFLLDQCRARGVKLVIATTFSGESMAVAERIFKEHLDFRGLKYGEHYVFLGWIPGYEAALAGLAKDIHAIAKVDYYGTPLEKIPMMKDIRSIEDFAFSGFSSSTSPDPYPRQWSARPILANVLAGTVGWLMPYVEKGIVTAYISGISGGAELEYLTGRVGLGTKLIGAQSTAHFYAMILVILANIYYFGVVRGRRMRRV